ncbi:MAG: CHAT domain-containing protein [Planctomycetota bacterium]|nr:CHAT domain-containing protein [Planctomycetota bacterium]
MRRALCLLLLLALAPLGVEAEDEDPGRTPEQLADAVLAAFETEAEGAMAKLAAEEPPDPWLVADHLVAKGHFDAAIAFAEAMPRPDVAKLPSWIETQRRHPTPELHRKRLAEARAHLAAKRYEEAFKAVDGLIRMEQVYMGQDLHAKSVTSVHLLEVGGRALLADGLVGGAQGIVDAAQMADMLGWRYAARTLAAEAGATLDALRADNEDNMLFHMTLANATKMNIGLGEYESAASMLAKQVTQVRAQENWFMAHSAGEDLARCYVGMGRYQEAQVAADQAYDAAQKLGFEANLATTEKLLSNIAEKRGDSRTAIRFAEKAAERFKEGGVPALEEMTRFRIAMLWRELAEYPRTFRVLETCLALTRKLENIKQEAFVLSQIGATYRLLGNDRKAREYMEQAIDLIGERGAPLLVASIFLQLGNLQRELDGPEASLEAFTRALELYALNEFVPGIAIANANIAGVHAEQKRVDEALAASKRSIEAMERGMDDDGRARILLSNGQVLATVGRLDEGVRMLERARDLSEQLEMPEMALSAYRALVVMLTNADRHERSLAAAKRALPWVPRVMGGLAAEESATVRARNASLFDAATLSAWQLESPADAMFFLESGRAGSLLESLGGRDTLQRATVPRELLERATETRAREARALARYRDAAKSMRRRVRRNAKKALDAARAEVERVVERIQLETAAGASLVYPEPASLADIQKALAADEALVLYAMTRSRTLAVVITKAAAKIVDLGKTSEVEGLANALLLTKAGSVWEPPAQALRTRVVDRLKLPATVKTVLVSPAGALSYVPFALLLPDRVVAYAPSGSTHVLLSKQAPKPGEGILALGDPAYADGTLPRLPGTRAEAGAIGTDILLSDKATEAGLLAAIAKRPRWRAMHLACHGLIDADVPLRSALALTPTKDSDGMLTVLDVIGRSIPTDLAVLSACETGKGQVVRAEGIVGLTRAFMVAGAPRVICSLWKVDDEATRALMERFYALWLGTDAQPGKPPAEALREAQAFVKNHPEHPDWKHPYYWGAWVLWGLPK